MGLNMKKSFIVLDARAKQSGANTPSSFVFQRYNHTVDMWQGEVWNRGIKNKILGSLRGTPQEANFISSMINKINTIIETGGVTDDERQLLADLTSVRWAGKNPGEDHLAKSLLVYAGGTATKRGFSFENRFDELIQALFLGKRSYKTGNVGVDIRADQQVQLSNLDPTLLGRLSLDIIPNIKDGRVRMTGTSAHGTKQRQKEDSMWGAIREQLKREIKKDTGIDFYKLLGTAALSMDYVAENGKIKDLFIYRARVPQKIDIEVPNYLMIDEDIHPDLQKLGRAILGKTFSLKNYFESTYKEKHGVGIGDSDEWRRLSSIFVYASDKHGAYADTATFVMVNKEFQSKAKSAQHSPKTVQRYLAWGKRIYELLGVGQRLDNRLPDYLVVNLYNEGQFGSGRVTIRATQDYLAGMPVKDPPFLYKGRSGSVDDSHVLI